MLSLKTYSMTNPLLLEISKVKKRKLSNADASENEEEVDNNDGSSTSSETDEKKKKSKHSKKAKKKEKHRKRKEAKRAGKENNEDDTENNDRSSATIVEKSTELSERDGNHVKVPADSDEQIEGKLQTSSMINDKERNNYEEVSGTDRYSR